MFSHLLLLLFTILTFIHAKNTTDLKSKLKHNDVSEELFDYVALSKKRLTLNETLLHLEMIKKVSSDEEVDYDQVFSEIQFLRKALVNVGRYMRDHKFNDINWIKLAQTQDKFVRVFSTNFFNKYLQQSETNVVYIVLRYLYSNHQYEFPELDFENSEAKSNCESSGIQCITEINDLYEKSNLDSNRTNAVKSDDTDEIMQSRLQPFTEPDTRFRYRATVSQYLCNYTLNGNILFKRFREPCKDILPMNDIIELKNDDEDFGCAMLSFCPDFCYGHARLRTDLTSKFKENCLSLLKTADCTPLTDSLKQKNGYINTLISMETAHRNSYAGNFSCEKSHSNSKCRLSLRRNKNFRHLKKNHVNHTCACKQHYESHNGVCVDHDECESSEHNCTQQNQVCMNTIGSFECICKDGFTFNTVLKECHKKHHFIPKPLGAKNALASLFSPDRDLDESSSSSSGASRVDLLHNMMITIVILLRSALMH